MINNLAAVAENEKNRKHIKLTHGGGMTTMHIDSQKVTYRGIPAGLLSTEQKKKLENIVLFMFIDALKQVPQIKYV